MLANEERRMWREDPLHLKTSDKFMERLATTQAGDVKIRAVLKIALQWTKDTKAEDREI